MRLQAALAAGKVGKPKGGMVTDYDADTYSAKVMLQPEGIETGWLPIQTSAAGSGWGDYAGPLNGAQAIVSFLEGDREVGWITGFLASDEDLPPSPGPPAGEFWKIHQSGSLLKFTNDGDVLVTTQRDLVAAVGRDAHLTVEGNMNSQATNWTHTGPLHVTEDITCDTTITATTDVIGGGKHLKTHTHSGVTVGGSNTGQPV
jgi:phage baseplate assembly protein V